MFASCHAVELSDAACAALPSPVGRRACLGGVEKEERMHMTARDRELEACPARHTDALLRVRPCQDSDAGIGCCGDGFCEWAELSTCPADCQQMQRPPPPPPTPSPPPPAATTFNGFRWSKMNNATEGNRSRRAIRAVGSPT